MPEQEDEMRHCAQGNTIFIDAAIWSCCRSILTWGVEQDHGPSASLWMTIPSLCWSICRMADRIDLGFWVFFSPLHYVRFRLKLARDTRIVSTFIGWTWKWSAEAWATFYREKMRGRFSRPWPVGQRTVVRKWSSGCAAVCHQIHNKHVYAYCTHMQNINGIKITKYGQRYNEYFAQGEIRSTEGGRRLSEWRIKTTIERKSKGSKELNWV